MKIGQKVKLKHLRKGKGEGESENWSKKDGLKLNEIYIVSYIHQSGWIDLDGKMYAHPPSKFELVIPKSATLEIYPYRGGFRYRKIAANGKILNHHYNTKQAASKGADAEARFWSNYKKVYK